MALRRRTTSRITRDETQPGIPSNVQRPSEEFQPPYLLYHLYIYTLPPSTLLSAFEDTML